MIQPLRVEQQRDSELVDERDSHAARRHTSRYIESHGEAPELDACEGAVWIDRLLCDFTRSRRRATMD